MNISIYEMVFSVFAIIMGVLMLFFMDKFIEGNIKVCRYLFEKTKLPLFKFYAEGMSKDSVRLTAYIVAIVFIVAGGKELSGL